MITKLQQLRNMKNPQPSGIFMLETEPTKKMAREIVEAEIASLRTEMDAKMKEMLKELEEKKDRAIEALLTDMKDIHKEYISLCENIKGMTEEDIAKMKQEQSQKFDEVVKRVKSLEAPKGEQGERGLKGERGEQGEKGENGKDGIEITPDQVIEKVIASEKLIPYNKIAGLVDELRKIMSVRRPRIISGGGDVVTAGSNITITRVNGRKQISSTGGVGASYLTATETPDGSIDVFTFALASAQPSFLWRDYAKYPPVSKSGLTLWTWNAGAKQATLVNMPPPVEDLYAEV